MSDEPLTKAEGLTERQAEIWQLFADLDLTREEAVNSLCGAIDGIENLTGQRVAETTADLIQGLRAARDKAKAAVDESLDNAVGKE